MQTLWIAKMYDCPGRSCHLYIVVCLGSVGESLLLQAAQWPSYV